MKILFIIFLLTVLPLSGFGFDSKDDLGEEAKAIYDYHFEQCSQLGMTPAFVRGMDLAVFKNSAGQFFGTLGGNPESIYSMIHFKGRSAVSETHLASLGYYYALRDCYPENESARNSYTLGFIMSDASAKAGAVASMYLMSKFVIKKLVSRLSATGQKWLWRFGKTTAVLSVSFFLYQQYRPRTEEEKAIFNEVMANSTAGADALIQENIALFKRLLEINEAVLKKPGVKGEEVIEAHRRIKLLTEQLESMGIVEEEEKGFLLEIWDSVF